MILELDNDEFSTESVPRVGGGDPAERDTIMKEYLCSPRRRG